MGPARGRIWSSRRLRHWRNALRISLRLFFIAGLMVFGSFAGAQAQLSDYVLGSGDQLRVTIFGQEDLSGEFSVSSTGVISMPLIGDVKSGGLTIKQLEEAIENSLRPDYLKNPRVSVEVINFRPFFIIGEVNNPGSYPFRPGMTVVNAVAMAGGYTYRARKNRFEIRRAQSKQRADKEDANEMTAVWPGDVIRVLERFF